MTTKTTNPYYAAAVRWAEWWTLPRDEKDATWATLSEDDRIALYDAERAYEHLGHADRATLESEWPDVEWQS